MMVLRFSRGYILKSRVLRSLAISYTSVYYISLQIASALIVPGAQLDMLPKFDVLDSAVVS